MNPNTAPNSLPPLFYDPDDWRATYDAYVQEYKNSDRGTFRELILRTGLKRLGYVGANLETEMTYIKENA